MPLVYRLQKAKHLATLLTGEGARLYGGRWNPVGVPLLYTSATPELAVLETLVHLDETPLDELPPFVLLEIELPESLHVFEKEALPEGWAQMPIPTGLSTFLLPWLRDPEAALAYSVPSVIVPWSRNVLVNPIHHLVNQVRIVRQEAFRFDNRLR